MPEEEDFTPEFIKGFNEGYTLAQHDPELLKNLLTVKDKEASQRIQGLQSGQKQHRKEILLKEQMAIVERQKQQKKTK